VCQNFLENMPNLKLRYMTHYWKETNRNQIIKFLEFFLLQGLHQKLNDKSYFSQRKLLETPVFLDLFHERRFHLLLKFHFVNNKGYEATCSSKNL
jgi:hypothetical protein